MLLEMWKTEAVSVSLLGDLPSTFFFFFKCYLKADINTAGIITERTHIRIPAISHPPRISPGDVLSNHDIILQEKLR